MLQIISVQLVAKYMQNINSKLHYNAWDGHNISNASEYPTVIVHNIYQFCSFQWKKVLGMNVLLVPNFLLATWICCFCFMFVVNVGHF